MIVNIMHNRGSYKYSIESPETTLISDIKNNIATVLNCYQNNIRIIYSGFNQEDNIYLSEYNRNNITFYAAIIPIVCQMH